MIDPNHYQTLQVSAGATQTEIKQAYRRLVKLFHPDSNSATANHEEIIRINAAYEVLSDTYKRQSYDRQWGHYQTKPKTRQQRTADAQTQHRASYQSGKQADAQLQEWLQQVYQPVNHCLCQILNSLESQLQQLAADPFDDQLIEDFQAYLKTCRDSLKRANSAFRSMPNPPRVARAAAHLYYCLNQVGDGIEQLEFFPLNYDDRYLHIGQELFRIAVGLHCEAKAGLEAIA